MQFHLNGFHPGDPHILHTHNNKTNGVASSETLPSDVDVLIVGAGPAGLLLAAQLSIFPDIKVRITEQKPGRLEIGQADGLQCRTIEMFEAFGFSERVLKESYWVNETVFWKPDPQGSGKIVRSDRIRDTEEGLSEFPHVILTQARIHDFFLDNMANSPTRLEPSYSRRLASLEVGNGPSSDKPSHPVQVKLERVDEGHEGEIETVRAKYVVGCDGARSAVRRSLGLSLKGDSANSAWGVMDALISTDFPDYRFKTVIHSKDQGNMQIIPREGGYLVRMYIEMDKLAADERVAARNITLDDIHQATKRIMHPYRVEFMETPWWSVYEIGQRLCDRFDNVPLNQRDQTTPRVFITGDACHTHSPKAGQGMNVSMADAYNLGWKLAMVLRGQASETLLRTYSDERQAIAQDLIDFDRELARLFSAKMEKQEASKSADVGADAVKFQKYFEDSGAYMAGTLVTYKQSIIRGAPTYQHLAKRLKIGMRFHSVQVVRLADAKPVHLGHTIKADGRWRIMIFGDAQDIRASSSPMAALCKYLLEQQESPIKKYTPSGADVDSVIDVRAVLQQSHRDIDLTDVPDLVKPIKGKLKMHDYEKVFCDEPSDSRPHESFYTARQIDREQGCMVIVRPDAYVAHVLPLDAYDELSAFFDGFMVSSKETKV